jgi:hypothetical protein
VLYYGFSLKVEQTEKTRRIIFARVAENVGFLSNYAKEAVLSRCIIPVLLHFKHSRRKRNYLLLRLGYKYLKKKQFLIFAK